MTVEDCLLGATRHAAQALGPASETGTTEPGKRADLAIWGIERPAEFGYWMVRNNLHQRLWRGQ